MRLALSSVLLAWLALNAPAAAQDADLPPVPPPPPGAAPAPGAPAAPPGTPPPPAYEAAPAPAAAQPEAPAEPTPPANACVPACRTGFTCVNSQCVSACNPACGSGQTCTADLRCVAAPRQAVPQSHFFPEDSADLLARDPTAERHDGFMLRLTLGFGGGTVTRRVKNDAAVVLGGDGKTTLSGFAESFSVDIGGAPVENVIIHGRFSVMGLGNPHIERQGHTVDSSSDDTAGSLLFGPAITYYFMPINLYLTGAIGFGATWALIKDEDDQAHGSGGVAINADVGKEWWAGDQWGLGVAGRFWYATGSRTSDGVDLEYNMIGFTVVFSATYQ